MGLNKFTKALAKLSQEWVQRVSKTFQSSGRQTQLWGFRDNLPPRLFGSEARDGAAASLQQQISLGHFQNFARFVPELCLESTPSTLSCGSFGKSVPGSFISLG